AREGNHRRRLSHPLARGIPRQGWHAGVITARAGAPTPGPNTCNAGVPLRRPPTYIGAEPNPCTLVLALPFGLLIRGPDGCMFDVAGLFDGAGLVLVVGRLGAAMHGNCGCRAGERAVAWSGFCH